MTPSFPLPFRRRGRSMSLGALGRSTKLLSLDTFGLALEPTFLEPDHQHLLVAEMVGRRHPGVETIYPEARRRAEAKARLRATEQGRHETSLALIGDQLRLELVAALARTEESTAPPSRTGVTTLDPVVRSEATRRRQPIIDLPADLPVDLAFDPDAVADDAIETEVSLLQTLGRANPDALQLHLEARERGIATALIADTPLPRDLIARIARSCGFEPDHVIVSSNEGRQKGSGLYRRLLAAAGHDPAAVAHFGPDPELDVDVPDALGITVRQAPDPADGGGPPLLLGMTRPRGLGSIALCRADRHRRRTQSGDTGPGRSSRSPEEAGDLGYYAGGPLLVGFAVWVGTQIDELEPDEVVLTGFAAPLVERALSILRPDLPADRRHRLPAGPDGRSPVHHLTASVPLARCRRMLVVDLGLLGQPHVQVRERLGALSPTPEVHGAYLGTLQQTLPNARTWAFAPTPGTTGDHRPVASADTGSTGNGSGLNGSSANGQRFPAGGLGPEPDRTLDPDLDARDLVPTEPGPAEGHGPALLRVAARRPEIIQALLHELPASAQDVAPALRPFHEVARSYVAGGTLAFVEDVEPWLHLDAGTLSGTMIEPALRVITNPTGAEAAVLGTYPSWDGPTGRSPALIPSLVRSSTATPAPTDDDESTPAGSAGSPWLEGARALADERADARRRRFFLGF